MDNYNDCIAYISNEEPIEVRDNIYTYEYDDISDILYYVDEDDFVFVKVCDRHKIPWARTIHRIDGPAHLLRDSKVWYLNGVSYSSVEEWLRLSTLSDCKKVKLRLKYTSN